MIDQKWERRPLTFRPSSEVSLRFSSLETNVRETFVVGQTMFQHKTVQEGTSTFANRVDFLRLLAFIVEARIHAIFQEFLGQGQVCFKEGACTVLTVEISVAGDFFFGDRIPLRKKITCLNTCIKIDGVT
jgi:hypothetical protein